MATYCLIIKFIKDSTISVGKIGSLNFKKGYYIYVGSALNSIDARVKRHLKEDKKLFWHIDYFLNSPNSSITKVILERSNIKWECDIAAEISNEGSGIMKFGCSDCKCNSHLFYFENSKIAENTVINAFRKFKLDFEEFDKSCIS